MYLQATGLNPDLSADVDLVCCCLTGPMKLFLCKGCAELAR